MRARPETTIKPMLRVNNLIGLGAKVSISTVPVDLSGLLAHWKCDAFSENPTITEDYVSSLDMEVTHSGAYYSTGYASLAKLGDNSIHVALGNYTDSLRSELMPASSECSISFWSQARIGNFDPQELLWLEDSGGANKIGLIRLHDDGFNFMRVGDVDSGSSAWAGPEWHPPGSSPGTGTLSGPHYVVTSKGHRQRLYHNGVLIIEDTGYFPIANLARRFQLGPMLVNQNFYIDEISVFNRELSKVDVLHIYNSGDGLAVEDF